MSETIHLHIDGQLIHTERDFHNLISPLLDFGPYYGNNLNALWDMLSSGVGENTVLHWENSDLARARLGETFNTITSRSFHQYIYKLNEIKVKLFPPENDW